MRINRLVAISAVIGMLAFALACPVTNAKDEKLKPEELVAKHLDSIGSAAKRNAVKSRVSAGSAEVVFRVGGTGNMKGAASIVSQGNQIRASFSFPSNGYPGEQIAFDGTKVTAGEMSPGNYPPFSGFLYETPGMVKEGLLFGALSTNWALLDLPARQTKLELTGLKKIDGRQLYELKYSGRNNRNDMQAWLYFDPETFHHVRSEFKLERASQAGTAITDSANPVRFHIAEEFNQFKEEDGLTLPRSYKLDFSIEAPRGSMLTSWTYTIDRIVHDQALDSQLFKLR
jgi:hypothetical protein